MIGMSDFCSDHLEPVHSVQSEMGNHKNPHYDIDYYDGWREGFLRRDNGRRRTA